jgi:nitrous oxidase accessory protein NosD
MKKTLTVLLVGMVVVGLGVGTVWGQMQRPTVAAPDKVMLGVTHTNVGNTNPGKGGISRRVLSTTSVSSVSLAGGNRLVAMQYTDGSWGWPLTAPPTYPNIIGPIAMGLAQAYQQTGNAPQRTALINAGAYLLTKDGNFSPSDGYLAAVLDKVLGVTTYTAYVKQHFYDMLASGTYQRVSDPTFYTTASYVDRIRTTRTGDQANMAAWDIGMGLVGAASCGASTADWIAGVEAEINELDGTQYYDVIGLAGAVYGLAFVGEDFDPTAGQHAAASNLNDLAAILAGYQLSTGGFTWNSQYVTENEGNETNQETAYAILALNQVNRTMYLSNIHHAADYLMSVQLGTGGWDDYPGDPAGENNELTGEALWGISAAYPAPVYNVNKDVYYPTIQGAVNDANAGNTVLVAAGTYHERLTINKSVDLRGAQYGVDPTAAGARTNPALESIVDVVGLTVPNPDVLMEIPLGVTNVLVSGFTLNGGQSSPHNADQSTIRCWDDNITIQDNIIDGYTSILYKGNDYLTVQRNRITTNKGCVIVQPNPATNVTISNNKMSPGNSPESDCKPIYMTGTTNSNVTGNTATGFTGYAALSGSDHSHLTVSGNAFTGNLKGVSIWGSSTFITITNNTLSNSVSNGIEIKGQDITISGNFINGNAVGIYVDKHVLETQRVTISNNDLSANGTAMTVTAAVLETVNASSNWWGTNTPAGVLGMISTSPPSTVDYTPWLDVGTDTQPATVGFQGDFSNLWVSVASPQTGLTGIIQEGVDLVSGSTVNVASGTYHETVNITKTVNLVGNSFPVIDGGGNGTLLTIAADNVSVIGFTIQNAATGVLITSGSRNSVRFNNILNHTAYGVNNTTANVVNAEYNWWGDANGPQDNSDDRASGGLYNPTGTAGSKVSDKVDYDPWVGTGMLTGPLFAAAGHSVIKIGGTEDIDLVFLGNNFKGCTALITFVGTVVNFVSVTPDAVLGTGGFAQSHDLNQSTGTVTIDIAYLQSGVLNNPGTIATIRFQGIASGTSPITISSVQVRDANNNPVAVGTILNEQIIVDGTAPTITLAPAAGGYYKTPPTFTTFLFEDDVALDKGEYQIDAGTWTTIFSDAMGTEWDGAPWTLPAADFTGLSDGASHTIHFKATDDATNETTVDWQFYKDITPPAAVTGVTATPGGSVDLTWTVVLHATPFEFDKLEIRRNAWGTYPSYSGSAPSYPSNTEGLLVTTIHDGTTTSYRDPVDGLAFGTRDIYYYQLFVYDKAGNVSPVNASAQARATNYLLGDIATAGTPPPNYDNTVNFSDLNPWSIAYGTKQGDVGYVAEYDFGPTDNNSRLGIPEPWAVKGSATVAYQIQFEDLMIFAMNYNIVLSKSAPPVETKVAKEFALELQGQVLGDEMLVTVHLANDGRPIKGASILLRYDPTYLAVKDVTGGALFGTLGQVAFFAHKEEMGTVQMDAAALGIDRTVDYSGDIGTIRFKVLKSGDTGLGFGGVNVRNGSNEEVSIQTKVMEGVSTTVPLPTTYGIAQNYPNPFNPTTTIAYQVPEVTHVTVEVYNVLGERVATLVDEQQAAGYYTVEWNGKDGGQRTVSSGVYYYRMSAGQFTSIKKMLLVK